MVSPSNLPMLWEMRFFIWDKATDAYLEKEVLHYGWNIEFPLFNAVGSIGGCGKFGKIATPHNSK